MKTQTYSLEEESFYTPNLGADERIISKCFFVLTEPKMFFYISELFFVVLVFCLSFFFFFDKMKDILTASRGSMIWGLKKNTKCLESWQLRECYKTSP